MGRWWTGGERWGAWLRVHLGVGAVLVGVAASTVLVVGSTEAAFTATAGSGASFEAGSVVISDDDAGSALFSVADLRAGDVVARCVTVTYTGTLAAQVRLHAATGGTGLAAYLTLKITRGSLGSPPGGGSCTGFTADTTDYAGLGAGVLYDSTLSTFTTSWATGTVDPSTTTFPAAETWTVNEQHAYHVQVTVVDDTDAQGKTATPTFTWEARARAPGYAQEVLTDDPVSYWRLGEAAGTTATDGRGAHNGTYTGGPTLGAAGALFDDPNTATAFDGVDDRVQVPYAAALNPAAFSVEAWAKAGAGAGFRTVVSSWTDAGVSGGFGIWADGGNWSFYVAGSNSNASVSAPLTVDTWTHIVGTYDGTTLRLYIDGQLVDNRTGSYAANTTSPLSIGAATYDGTTWTDLLNGSVDEVAVYDTVLTQPRIQAHHDAGR